MKYLKNSLLIFAIVLLLTGCNANPKNLKKETQQEKQTNQQRSSTKELSSTNQVLANKQKSLIFVPYVFDTMIARHSNYGDSHYHPNSTIKERNKFVPLSINHEEIDLPLKRLHSIVIDKNHTKVGYLTYKKNKYRAYIQYLNTSTKKDITEKVSDSFGGGAVGPSAYKFSNNGRLLVFSNTGATSAGGYNLYDTHKDRLVCSEKQEKGLSCSFDRYLLYKDYIIYGTNCNQIPSPGCDGYRNIIIKNLNTNKETVLVKGDKSESFDIYKPKDGKIKPVKIKNRVINIFKKEFKLDDKNTPIETINTSTATINLNKQNLP